MKDYSVQLKDKSSWMTIYQFILFEADCIFFYILIF